MLRHMVGLMSAVKESFAKVWGSGMCEEVRDLYGDAFSTC